MSNSTPDEITQPDDSAFFQQWLVRLLSKSTLQEGGCWLWNGWVTHKGYGTTTWHSKRVFIHRKVFEMTHGRLLLTEEFACHTCDNRNCWNPAHLFLGDAEANNNDCAQKGRHHNTVKTHCKWGHLFDEANTSYKTLESGSIARVCKTCQRLKAKTDTYVAWRRNYQRQRREQARQAKRGTL